MSCRAAVGAHALVTVTPVCVHCGIVYTRTIEPEMVPLLMAQGRGQCDACYEAQELARDMA